MSSEGRRHGAGGGQELAPSVVRIFYNLCSTAVKDGNDVALDVCDVIIIGTVIGHRHGRAVGIVGKVQGVAAHGHLAQTAAVIDVAVCSGAVGSAGS